jgi:predicted enzyme related to lactoylglutathione lyase
MPEYAPGTPSWIELSSPDVAASAAFYGELMDWNATEPGPPESGGYQMFQLDGQNIAGLMGQMQEGQPTAWMTYISVADADETAGKVKASGGSVIVEPMDVMDIGRMAVFADPTGAVFGVWQPKTFAGADLVNEPGSLVWNEVLTRDADAGKSFYPAVFGWTAGRPSFEGAPESYTVWEVDGKPVGGMMHMTEEYFPPEIPTHWGVCFAVADCEATVAKARELGARVTQEPMDCPIGKFAGFIDPQGASFTVMQPASGGSD